jgi:hypothetical protein
VSCLVIANLSYVPRKCLPPWGALLRCVGGLAVTCGWLSATRVESFLGLLLGLVVGTFLIALLLFDEYHRAAHGEPGAKTSERELSQSKPFAVLRWCPRWLKFALPIGFSLIFAAPTFIGSAGWSSSKPFTERDAKVFLLTIAGFLLMSLPILASASRMPGAFQDRFSAKGRFRDA